MTKTANNRIFLVVWAIALILVLIACISTHSWLFIVPAIIVTAINGWAIVELFLDTLKRV